MEIVLGFIAFIFILCFIAAIFNPYKPVMVKYTLKISLINSESIIKTFTYRKGTEFEISAYRGAYYLRLKDEDFFSEALVVGAVNFEVLKEEIVEEKKINTSTTDTSYQLPIQFPTVTE